MQSRVLDFINGGPGSFEDLALEVFEFQRERNAVYRAYCDRQPKVTRWKEIPAVPTSAFKDFDIACFPVAEAVAEFRTSGTTREKAGKHYFKTLELYDAAIRPNFELHLQPVDLPVISLIPAPQDAPHSSLSHMLSVIAPEAVSFMPQRLAGLDKPVLLFGTAFAFMNFFDQKLHLRLPEGSRAMETGGFKGRSREVTKVDLYRMFADRLGIQQVVNEYGMTELSTQFYDERPGSDIKDVPHWSRVLIIDPHTGKEALPGERGLIRIFDLANLWSAICIQTEDLGIGHEDGRFEVLGRAAGAEVRGCSLNAESFLSK